MQRQWMIIDPADGTLTLPLSLWPDADLDQVTIVDPHTLRRCSACKGWMDAEEFGNGEKVCRTCAYEKYYEWCLKNPDKKRAALQRRRVAKAGTEAETTQPYTRATLWERQAGICSLCSEPMEHFSEITHRGRGNNRRKATVDHIIPISHGGSDCASNVQLVHWSCNSKKGNRV